MAENKIQEPSADFAERLLQKIHEGLGLLRLVREIKEEEIEEDEPSSFMDVVISSSTRKSRSEEIKSEKSFLDLI